MKRLCAILFYAIILASSANLVAQSDVIYTEPEFPTQFDDVTVYFDATKGNAGLAGFNGDVYFHTGVITPQSQNSTEWKHVVGNWGTEDPNVLMQKEGENLYSVSFNIESYYNINPGEEVLQLAFVFRSADGSVSGREADGSDILTEVYPSDAAILASVNSPKDFALFVIGESVPVNISVNKSVELTISDNGSEIYSEFTDLAEFQFIPEDLGKHELEFNLRLDEDSIILNSEYFVIDQNAPGIDPPDGIKNGLNYNTDNTLIFQLEAPGKNFAFFLCPENSYEVNEDYRMQKSVDGRYFWIEIDKSSILSERSTYQYLVDELIIADPFSTVVLDPNNDWEIPDHITTRYADYPADLTNGIVSTYDVNKETFEWELDKFDGPDNDDLIIYELLMRDFLDRPFYDELTDTLDYLADLGINAIQFMPVSEFEGNNSWGYNPSFHMALDKAYGNVDQFKQFIDEAHKRGIAVIIDVVYNHVFSQSPLAQLYWDAGNFRPSADNPWLNVIAKHPFNVGYDVNHEYEGSKNWVKQILDYWLTEYKIDGFRFDLSKGFTQRNSGSNSALMSQYDSGRVAILKDYTDHVWSINPDAYVIMEHFADNVEERELAAYGMMLWGNMSHQFAEAAMGYTSSLKGADYTWRGFNAANLIAYMESHDEERMAYKIQNFGNSNGLYDTQELDIALMRVEAASSIYYSIPGPKMLWKFGELGYDFSINRCTDGHISEDCRLSSKPITWNYIDQPDRNRLYTVNAALAHLRNNYPVFSTDDFSFEESNYVKRVYLNHPDMDVVSIANFNVDKEEAKSVFPYTGSWYEYFSASTLEIENTNQSLELEAGEYRIFTSEAIDPVFGVLLPPPGTSVQISGFHVIPNPVSAGESIIILGDIITTDLDYSIVDMSGRLIQNGTTKSRRIDIAYDHPPGIYYLYLEHDSEPIIRKFAIGF